MSQPDLYFPFGLRVRTGNLLLRPITDEVLPGLVELALAGIHDPEAMPFAVPWTDAGADPHQLRPIPLGARGWTLTSEDLVRGDDLVVEGVEAFRHFIGLD